MRRTCYYKAQPIQVAEAQRRSKAATDETADAVGGGVLE
jgi:hypothetical protein